MLLHCVGPRACDVSDTKIIAALMCRVLVIISYSWFLLAHSIVMSCCLSRGSPNGKVFLGAPDESVVHAVSIAIDVVYVAILDTRVARVPGYHGVAMSALVLASLC